VTPEPHAFLTLEYGAATTSVALIGRAGGAWRLIGRFAMSADTEVDPAIDLLLDRTHAADPRLAEGLGLVGIEPDRLARLEVRSRRPRRLAVAAGSERTLAGLVATAGRSGWRVEGASAEATDPLAMTRLLLDHEVEAVLIGAADPPRAEERGAIRELAALVASVAIRRPDLAILLSGAMSEGLAAFGDVAARPGEIILAPPATSMTALSAGAPDALGTLLLELALPADDPRRAIDLATVALAEVLDRRIEAIVLGHGASVRAVADPPIGEAPGDHRIAVVPGAAVAPEDIDDGAIDDVQLWLTSPADRHRLRDRMRELRIAPWADAAGDGAALRLAAGRAALGRLAAATPDLDGLPAPDLVICGGGLWSAIPGPMIALAHMDVIRRAGASQYAHDHARLLGALGAIPDGDERLALVADLADDVLAPLGSVVMPAGLRAGRSAGSVVVHAADGPIERDLTPGGLELVELPPGATAVAEFRFRDRVRLGARGRHFAVDVSGGLGGLMVDLRDVPLRLPDRADRRRDLLGKWQSALWAGTDP
jgi:hypothetical protein